MKEEDKRYYMRLVVTVLMIVVVMVVARLLFFQKERSGGVVLRENVSPAIPAKGSTTAISWQDATKHDGEYCTIEGTIVATHNSGKACFLNFHPNWKKYFTAVIFANRYSSFPASPEDYYRGKKVRVTGYIKEYKGKPEIILESPDQVEILD